MTESSSREQASVVFMGRGSFRMEAVGGPGLNDLAIPNRASDIPTERIFRAKSDSAFLAVPLPASAVVHPRRSASKGAFIGLGGLMFVLGMLVTSPAAHSWLRIGHPPAQVVPTPVAAAVAVLPVAVAPTIAPVAVTSGAAAPAIAPVIAPVAEPIVVAVAAPEPAVAPAPAPRAALVAAPKLARATRARVVRPAHAKHRAEAATGGPLPEPEPESSNVSPAPAKKWVDPFAD